MSHGDDYDYDGGLSFDNFHWRDADKKSKEYVEDEESDREPSFLVWRRLHLSRAKLRSVTEMAALLAGFSVVATVELDVDKNTSPVLLTFFAVTTSLLVSTTMLSIMIATCILPHLDAVAKLNSTNLVKHSPHDALIKYVDLSWALANTFSILLFIVDVILLSWIKFKLFPSVCIAFTAIMIPVLILLIVFSLVFYRQSVEHEYKDRKRKWEKLMEMKDVLDQMLAGRSFSSNIVARSHSLPSLQHV